MLANNKLTELPLELAALQMNELSLAGNQLDRIPPGMCLCARECVRV